MRRIVTGEQIAQLTNPDPFAVPRWRAPVYRTPGWIIAVVQLARLVWWLARLIVRHPVTDAVLVVLVLVWLHAGWPGLVALVLIVVTVLAGWRGPARSRSAGGSRARPGASAGPGSTGAGGVR